MFSPTTECLEYMVSKSPNMIVDKFGHVQSLIAFPLPLLITPASLHGLALSNSGRLNRRHFKTQ